VGGPATNEAFTLARLPGLVCDAAGLPGRPLGYTGPPAGVAVAEYDGLGGPEDPRVRAFAEKWALDAAAVTRLTESFTCATDGAWKLVVAGDGRESLYDLRADPAERSPLAPSVDAAVSGRLRAAIQAAAAGALGTGPAGAAARPAAAPEEIAALEQQMRLLGYL
jgi:hypothetical protein